MAFDRLLCRIVLLVFVSVFASCGIRVSDICHDMTEERPFACLFLIVLRYDMYYCSVLPKTRDRFVWTAVRTQVP